MPEIFKFRLIAVLLLLTFVILPLALLWIRRRPRTRTSRVLFGIGVLLHAICDTALIILLLLKLGLVELEWRGGYVPVLTVRKSKADFEALERSRAEQNKLSAAPVINTAAGANWTGFRGLRRDGQYDGPILTNWPPAGLRLLWKQPCGGGYSSFAMVDGRAFTLEQRRDQEVVVAYDVTTGREIWTNGWTARFTEYHSDEGPRTTPTWDDGKVYALGATGELRCLDAASGAVIWRKNIVADTAGGVPSYGIAASPLVVDDKVIVQPHAHKGKSVVCYDKRDGKPIWHSLDTTMGYASPTLVNLGGERQVVVCGRPFTYGLRLEDGTERWQVHWEILNNERQIAQPMLISTNHLLLSAAYMTGCAAFEIDRSGDTFQTREVWRNRNLKTKFASSVLWDGFVYGLDEDILVCIDARTGERKWKDGRYGYGQVLLASGHLIIQCANGDLALVTATPEKWTELARVPALHGKTWNVPALGAGRILVRNGAEMACFEIGPMR